MGFVIKINVCDKWIRSYFVQEIDEELAKEKAYYMFRKTMSCYLPDTLEEAEQNNNYNLSIDLIEEVDQIIL